MGIIEERLAAYADILDAHAETTAPSDTFQHCRCGERFPRMEFAYELHIAGLMKEVADAEQADLRAEIARLRGVGETHWDARTIECPECGSGEDGCCVCHQMKRAEAAEAKVKAVEALHVVAVNPTDWSSDWCAGCGRNWPCPTITVLDAEGLRAIPGLRAWSLVGGPMYFNREEWGVIIDALIQHRGHAEERKAVNSESNSDLRADMCADLIERINQAAKDPTP